MPPTPQTATTTPGIAFTNYNDGGTGGTLCGRYDDDDCGHDDWPGYRTTSTGIHDTPAQANSVDVNAKLLSDCDWDLNARDRDNGSASISLKSQ